MTAGSIRTLSRDEMKVYLVARWVEGCCELQKIDCCIHTDRQTLSPAEMTIPSHSVAGSSSVSQCLMTVNFIPIIVPFWP